MRRAMSSRFDSIPAPMRLRMTPRSLGGTADHRGNAAAAASNAMRVSAAPPSGTPPTTCPVAGSRTSNSAAPAAPIHSPLTYMRFRVPIDGLLPRRGTRRRSPTLRCSVGSWLDATRHRGWRGHPATGSRPAPPSGPCQRYPRRIDSPTTYGPASNRSASAEVAHDTFATARPAGLATGGSHVARCAVPGADAVGADPEARRGARHASAVGGAEPLAPRGGHRRPPPAGQPLLQ